MLRVAQGRGRRKRAGNEAITIRQARDDNELDQRKNGGILDMFLKEELTVCAEGWNARCKRKREVEDDA